MCTVGLTPLYSATAVDHNCSYNYCTSEMNVLLTAQTDNNQDQLMPTVLLYVLARTAVSASVGPVLYCCDGAVVSFLANLLVVL